MKIMKYKVSGAKLDYYDRMATSQGQSCLTGIEPVTQLVELRTK